MESKIRTLGKPGSYGDCRIHCTDLYDNPNRGQAESVSPRDRRDGGRTDFAEHIPDGTEPWSNRENESGKSDAVGTDDEQPENVAE